VIGRELKQIRGKEQQCILFCHEDFENLQLYCQEQYTKVITEGSAGEFFGAQVEEGVPEGRNEEEVDDLVQVPELVGDRAEDIARLCAAGYGVDDDNEPAPENIPQGNNHQVDLPILGQWGSRHECKHRSNNHRHEAPSIIGGIPADDQHLHWFLKFIAVTYIKEVLIPETNRNMLGQKSLDWSEFLCFIGLLFLLSTVRVGCSLRAWFEDTEPSEFEGAPFHLNKYMSHSRFESILNALTYTNIPPPPYKDKFFQICQMLKSWNEHMSSTFIPSWMSCLDESMSPWTSRWTCPGWMFVPRKPHPMGNEYHTIDCGVSGILYQMEMVEGKDRPPEIPAQHDEHGKTSGLLLHLTSPIWATGKIVVLDSEFCVLKAITELQKVGVYSSAALIKKRRYWPKGIPGEDIKAYFMDKAIGFTNRLPATSADEIPFDIFAMKEPDYVLIFMSTYGALVENPHQKISYRGRGGVREGPAVQFKYKEVIANHYNYRGAVDTHNTKRHDGNTGCGMSLEASWITQRWENRVFAYILATSEVNAYYLGRSFFCGGSEDETQFTFRQKLAFDLITYIDDMQRREGNRYEPVRTRRMNTHEKIWAPHYCKFVGGKWTKCLKRKQSLCLHSCNIRVAKNEPGLFVHVLQVY
jgi:hypothetical protein